MAKGILILSIVLLHLAAATLLLRAWLQVRRLRRATHVLREETLKLRAARRRLEEVTQSVATAQSTSTSQDKPRLSGSAFSTLRLHAVDRRRLR